jgi:hypothetical protein
VAAFEPRRSSITEANVGKGADGRAAELTQRLALGVFRPEPFLVRAGRSDHGEGRIGDVVGQHAADHQLGAALALDEVEIALKLFGQMPEEGFLGLVDMMVCVVDWKCQRFHILTCSSNSFWKFALKIKAELKCQ